MPNPIKLLNSDALARALTVQAEQGRSAPADGQGGRLGRIVPLTPLGLRLLALHLRTATPGRWRGKL